jgi:hypothetical protein
MYTVDENFFIYLDLIKRMYKTQQETKEVEVKLEEIYGFEQINFEKVFGKKTYTWREHEKFGYLTFKGERINSHVVFLNNPAAVVRELNKCYHDAKCYEVINGRAEKFKISKNISDAYIGDPEKYKGHTHYIDTHLSIIDVQNGKFVLDTNEHCVTLSKIHIYNNILRWNYKYIYLPTKEEILKCSYDTNLNEIRYSDTGIIETDLYLIFPASIYNGSYKNVKNLAYKLNKITGELTEIK